MTVGEGWSLGSSERWRDADPGPMGPSSAEFEAIARRVLDPLLAPLGFGAERDFWVRALPGGVLQMLVLDYRPKWGWYEARVGLGALLPSDPPETYRREVLVYRCLTARTLARGPYRERAKRMFVRDAGAAPRQLVRTAYAFQRSGVPWLNRFPTFAELAPLVPPELPFEKGMMWLAVGHLREARRWLVESEAQLRAMRDTPEARARLARTLEWLERCGR